MQNQYAICIYPPFFPFIAAAIRCQQRNREADKHEPESLHSLPAVFRLAEFRSSHCHLPHWSFDAASFCLRALRRAANSPPAFFFLFFSPLRSTSKLQRRIHHGMCSKHAINVSSPRCNFIFFCPYKAYEIISQCIICLPWNICLKQCLVTRLCRIYHSNSSGRCTLKAG